MIHSQNDTYKATQNSQCLIDENSTLSKNLAEFGLILT